MFTDWSLMDMLGRTVIVAPALLLAALSLPTLAGRPLGERATSWLVQIAMVVGLTAAVGVLVLMLLHGTRHETILFGNLVSIPVEARSPASAGGDAAATHPPEEHHFHFA